MGPLPLSELTAALRGWDPAPITAVDRIRAWPVDAFAGLLGQAGTVGADGLLPPLWHWFSFLDSPGRADLGSDGHPRDGAFLPPIRERRRMFAGGRVHWHGSVRVGEEIVRRSAVRRVDVKQGRSGAMVFVTVGHELHRDGRLLVDEEQDLVYRSQPAGQPHPAGQSQPAGQPHLAGRPEHPTPARDCDAADRLEFDTDPVTLFRFSALTYNSHRIHYDHRYTTDVEGYPDLVVHGPLLALLLLEFARRADGAGRLRSFTYQITRPVFVGTRIAATRRVGAGGEHILAAGPIDAPAAISGVTLEKAGNP